MADSTLVLLLLVPVILAAAVVTFHTHIPRLRLTKFTSTAPLGHSCEHQLRILQLSDLHLRKAGAREKLAILRIRNSRPDLILITGDLIERQCPESEGAVASFVKTLGATAPILVVRGNAEFIHPGARDPLRTLDRIHGVCLLSNRVFSYQHLGRTVHFLGLDPYVDSAYQFTVTTKGGRLHIEGGGSWVDCFCNLRTEWAKRISLWKASHYSLKGRIKLASRDDLGGVLVCSQIPLGLDKFYRLTFGGGYPVRFSTHGGNLNLGERFSDLVLDPNTWYQYKIEVNVQPQLILLAAKIWLAGDPEPKDYLIECGDASRRRLENGTIGFWSSRGGGIREYTLDRIYDFTRKQKVTPAAEDVQNFFEESFVDEAPWSDLAQLDTENKLSQLLRETPREGLKVLLCHDPDVVRFLDESDVDIVLTGHTHGGQITLPFLRRFLGYPAHAEGRNGSVCRTGRTLVVRNNGLGTSGVPLRLGARCEMILLKI